MNVQYTSRVWIFTFVRHSSTNNLYRLVRRSYVLLYKKLEIILVPTIAKNEALQAVILISSIINIVMKMKFNI